MCLTLISSICIVIVSSLNFNSFQTYPGLIKEATGLQYQCLEVLSELLAEEAVDNEVGGAVDDGAEAHSVVENTGLGPNIVGDVMFLKYSENKIIKPQPARPSLRPIHFLHDGR